MSPAELASVCNEAAISAARANRDVVTGEAFFFFLKPYTLNRDA
jgi:ATP-dependent Zn protease